MNFIDTDEEIIVLFLRHPMGRSSFYVSVRVGAMLIHEFDLAIIITKLKMVVSIDVLIFNTYLQFLWFVLNNLIRRVDRFQMIIYGVVYYEIDYYMSVTNHTMHEGIFLFQMMISITNSSS